MPLLETPTLTEFYARLHAPDADIEAICDGIEEEMRGREAWLQRYWSPSGSAAMCLRQALREFPIPTPPEEFVDRLLGLLSHSYRRARYDFKEPGITDFIFGYLEIAGWSSTLELFQACCELDFEYGSPPIKTMYHLARLERPVQDAGLNLLKSQPSALWRYQMDALSVFGWLIDFGRRLEVLLGQTEPPIYAKELTARVLCRLVRRADMDEVERHGFELGLRGRQTTVSFQDGRLEVLLVPTTTSEPHGF